MKISFVRPCFNIEKIIKMAIVEIFEKVNKLNIFDYDSIQ